MKEEYRIPYVPISFGGEVVTYISLPGDAIPVEWIKKWHEGSPFSDIEVIRLLLADWENEYRKETL